MIPTIFRTPEPDSRIIEDSFFSEVLKTLHRKQDILNLGPPPSTPHPMLRPHLSARGVRTWSTNNSQDNFITYPFGAQQFDVILLWGISERHYRNAITKSISILKPGGRLLIAMPVGVCGIGSDDIAYTLEHPQLRVTLHRAYHHNGKCWTCVQLANEPHFFVAEAQV